jgi:dethiobiotin synthetase
MGKGIFVTGISTGVGKTVISSLICKKLLDAHYKVAYYKPVQTGGIKIKNNLVSSDCRFIQSVIGDNKNFSTSVSYIFEKPASPHYAAGLEDKTIDKNKIIDDCMNLLESNDFVIVEGAGGIYVPLSEDGFFIYDIPKALSLKIILAGYAGLGSINSVSLNYNFIESMGLKLAAVILITDKKTPSDIEADNARILKEIINSENIFLMPKAERVNTEKNKAGNILEKLRFFPDKKEIKRWINE